MRKVDSRVVRQKNPDRHRRWYRSPEADLLVDWDSRTGDVVSFELDWENTSDLRPYVRWGRGVGLTTGRLDTGDRLGALEYKRSPMVLLDDKLEGGRLDGARLVLRKSGLTPDLQTELLKLLRD